MKTGMHVVATKVLVVFMASIIMSGCYSFSSMSRVPDLSDNIDVASNDTHSEKIVYVSNIDVKLNGGAANTSDGFAKKVVSKLQQSNHFKEVSYGLYAKKPETPYYDLSFNIEENQDLNMGSNMTKAVFTGLTLFLLAPALPNSYDFTTDHNLLVMRPDGTKREYKASCAGSATGTYPYTGLVAEYNKISGDATERCLTSVVNQFAKDNSQALANK